MKKKIIFLQVYLCIGVLSLYLANENALKMDIQLYTAFIALGILISLGIWLLWDSSISIFLFL